MITLKNIVKRYGDHTVLDHLNLTFEEGRIYVITGESGRGKTTLLRLMMGLERPDEGTIEGISGKRLSAVFQEDRLLENLSVSRNIRLPKGHLSHMQKLQETADIKEDLNTIGLEGCSGMKVSELSGGMKRRVSILRALRTEYDIIFFDEASRGLDEANRKKTMNRIREGISGKTAFWVTHDLRDLDELRDYILIDLDPKITF